ncbi:glycosyltransferase family 9 protein [Roseomonas sp. CCTCC AB2023176]|uniref:glycosyltransferase family 9 protein n=1 Tax=Roseomonas sp. CCTCC AB2023176 TaxID=3342640 RepID=UPI0035DE13CE
MIRRVLVIKLGSLGDFVQAFEAFAAIRAHHPAARITLLTTKPYAGLSRRMPWFDEVWDCGRPGWADLPGVWRLFRRLRGGRFDRVYDLQNSGRSSRYRAFVGLRADWSGIAWGASHPQCGAYREVMHTVERTRDQLQIAGIRDFPQPDLDWLDLDVSHLGLPGRFVLLIPGASPHRPGKRWPHFPALAAGLDLPAVVLGVGAEAPLAAAIAAAQPATKDLTGRTSMEEIAAVARRAVLAVGNDTGPTHMAAAAGCPTVALFGGDSDPSLCGPRGPAVRILRRDPLDALSPAEVAEAARALP